MKTIQAMQQTGHAKTPVRVNQQLRCVVAFRDLLQVSLQRFRESAKKAEWKCGFESHQRIIDRLRDQRPD